VDATERARLVERHLDLARRVAYMIHPRVRELVDAEELVALANAGLTEAAQRFDPERGVAFTTFAWYRVQGAIIDGLRKSANLPRRAWAKLTALRAAGEYLEQRGERDAGAVKQGVTPARGADALAAMKDALSAIRTMYITSLEALQDSGFDPAEDAAGPADRLATGRLASRLRDAVNALPDKERALLTKHYWEGKNLLEAGAELGISKSWASRLHAQAVERLRAIVDAET
jgi:RNA polymerase sigma factor for flagellar operon FliA